MPTVRLQRTRPRTFLSVASVAVAISQLTTLTGQALSAASAEPLASDTVGTFVQVVIHKSFAVAGDSCVGVGALEAIEPGSQVALSPGSFQGVMPEVARGRFVNSRLTDGMCFVSYGIIEAPMMPTFGLQFIGPDGQASNAFGPVKSQVASEPDYPHLQQAVRADMEFAS